ncbi:Nn.00g018050.m01.CDS01 [Neocucurbitaria sp. VM-36]
MDKACLVQKIFVMRLIKQELHTVTSILEHLEEGLEVEKADVGEDIRTYSEASEQGKIDIVRQLWNKATDPRTWATFERHRQMQRMMRLRAIMRSHMTVSVPSARSPSSRSAWMS